MAIAKAIHKYIRVVAVRFDRCPNPIDPTEDEGTFDGLAPDPDARGFLPASVRGAILPIGLDAALDAATRPESRVRLIREDIEDAAQLFLTLSSATPAQITLPVPGSALPNTKFMMIKLRALAAGNTFLQVRFGSATGPIIHQMQIIVNAVQDLRVVAHAPTINGAARLNPATNVTVPAQTVRTDAQIRAMFAVANAIYFPYGIRFVVDAVIDRAPDPAHPLNFLNQGMVDDSIGEFERCTASNRVARVVNAYFIPQIANPNNPNLQLNTVLGSGNSARRNPGTFGLLVSDEAINGQTVAHELGHLLNLVNDPSGRFVHIDTIDGPGTRPGTGGVIRADIVSHRRLMMAFDSIAPDPDRPYRDTVGYGQVPNGNGQPGGLLTIKQYDADQTDLEMAEVQRTAGTLGRPVVP